MDNWTLEQGKKAAAEHEKQKAHDAEMELKREHGATFLGVNEAPLYPATNTMFVYGDETRTVKTGHSGQDFRPEPPVFMSERQFKVCSYRNRVTSRRCDARILKTDPNDLCGFHRSVRATGQTDLDIITGAMTFNDERQREIAKHNQLWSDDK